MFRINLCVMEINSFEILELKLPCLEFLMYGNVYSGSYGAFNFKVFPEVSVMKFKISVWLGLNCLERSEILQSHEFVLNDQGCLQAQEWLCSQFEHFKNKEL